MTGWTELERPKEKRGVHLLRAKLRSNICDGDDYSRWYSCLSLHESKEKICSVELMALDFMNYLF